MRLRARTAIGVFRPLLIFLVLTATVLPCARSWMAWQARGQTQWLPPDLSGAGSRVRVEVPAASVPTQRAVARAVAQLRLPPVGTLKIVVGIPRGECTACAAAYDLSTGEIAVASQLIEDPPALRSAIAHEVGHLVDARYLDAATRRRFSRMRVHPADLTWWAPDSPWRSRPDEDFAEAFSVLVQPAPRRTVATAYGRVDAPALEALLAERGLSIPEQRPPGSAAELVGREIAYARDALSPRGSHVVVFGVVALLAVATLAGALLRLPG